MRQSFIALQMFTLCVIIIPTVDRFMVPLIELIEEHWAMYLSNHILISRAIGMYVEMDEIAKA